MTTGPEIPVAFVTVQIVQPLDLCNCLFGRGHDLLYVHIVVIEANTWAVWFHASLWRIAEAGEVTDANHDVDGFVGLFQVLRNGRRQRRITEGGSAAFGGHDARTNHQPTTHTDDGTN